MTVGCERLRGGAGSLFGALLLRLGRLVVIRLDKEWGGNRFSEVGVWEGIYGIVRGGARVRESS